MRYINLFLEIAAIVYAKNFLWKNEITILLQQ